MRKGWEVVRNVLIREPFQQDAFALQKQRVAQSLSLVELSRLWIALRTKRQSLRHAVRTQLPEFRVNKSSCNMGFATDMAGPEVRNPVRGQRSAVRMSKHVCPCLDGLAPQGRKKALIATLQEQRVQKGRQQFDKIRLQRVASLARFHLYSVSLSRMPEMHTPFQGRVGAP